MSTPAVTPPPTSPSQRAGERAVGNTLLRAGGEMLGRLASLVLFAALGRSLGESGLGIFVFAFAWVQLSVMPPGLGLDRYFLRRVARDRAHVDETATVLTLKLVLTAPFVMVSLAAVLLLDYGDTTRLAIFVLLPGAVMDSLGQSLLSVFMAYERGGLVALAVVVQRFAAAGLGLAALAGGLGVVAVAGAYTVAGAAVLGVAVFLLLREVSRVALDVRPRLWRTLTLTSLPFAVQDVLTVLLARIDTVMLAFLAGDAAVGRYGAAYRLLESTFFITYAIAGAFAAMFTYLDHEAQPTLRAAFQRSIKLSLTVMVPLSVSMGVLARPIAELIFGADFGSAAPALRLLAPAVVLMSVVQICVTFVVSRESATPMAVLGGGMVALNVALNLLLIPRYTDRGAATAMLATELVALPVALVLASRRSGPIDWGSAFTGPLLAGAAMGATMLAVGDGLVVAGAAGTIVYLAVLVALERVLSPQDVDFMADMVRRRLSPRPRG